jgi:predicted MPP superfamily phosphohydrolase
VEWVLGPLHEQGLYQPVVGFLNGLDYLLQLPGAVLATILILRAGYDAEAACWLLGVAINFCLYFWAGFRAWSLWQWAVARPAVQPPPVKNEASGSEQRVSRRQCLAAGMRLFGGGVAAGLGYGLVIEPRWFTVTHRTVALRGLPTPLDGLRAVQLTDIHHGPWLSLAYVRQVVEAANGLRPDLVLLTGDYVYDSPAYIEPVITELAQLKARIGTVAVLGNHDWWQDGARTQQAFRSAGIPLLDNGRLILTPDGRLVEAAAEGLAVCGVGDLKEDTQDYRRALGGLPARMPRLLLSHNPDVAEEPRFVRSGLRVDLMISGHTHGGQVYIPLLGTPILPSRYGQKYAQGLVSGPVCPVFVSRGIGVSKLPLRVGVSPEIAVLEFRAASS